MRNARRVLLALGVPILLAAGDATVSSAQGDRRADPPPDGALTDLGSVTGESDPKVYVDGDGTVYRLWVRSSTGQGGDIQFQRSADGGRTWPAAPVTLDRDKPAGARSTSPELVAGSGGRLLTIWRTKYREQQSRKELQFLASPDRGLTWPGPPRVLSQGGGAMPGSIATGRDGLVVAAWYDERRTVPRAPTRSSRGFKIYINRSEDFGLTWLPDGTELSDEARQDAAAGSSDATEPRDGEQGARSRRRGAGFISALPVVAADGRGGVFVAWIDNREGRTEIYFRASADDGKSWGPEVNVSRGALSATNHRLLTDGENGVFLVWSDGRHGADDVFFARSEDGGKHWTAPTRLSRRPQGKTVSTFPHMALDPDGRLYVAWQDRRNGREDIYMNISADRGKTWLERDIRLDRDDPGTGISRTPYVVARKGGHVAVVWSDDRSGFDRLLLNWSRDGGATWPAEEISVDVPGAATDHARNGRLAWDETGVLHAVWEAWKGEGQQVEKHVEYRRLTLPSDRG